VNNLFMVHLILCRMEDCQKVVSRQLSLDDFDLKIGFIGAGKMAQALSLGFVQSGQSYQV